jgi:hypothetical protein
LPVSQADRLARLPAEAVAGVTARYAAETSVSAEASRAEIERTLRRYGADAFVYAEDRGQVTIMFRINGRMVRFLLPQPRRDDPAFTKYQRGVHTVDRAETEAQRRWEQACRTNWRALALVIKAKLEAAAAGITTIEDEFLAHTMMNDGVTVGERVREQLEEHYRVGGPAVLRLEAPR